MRIAAAAVTISCALAGSAYAQDARATWSVRATDHFEVFHRAAQRGHVDAVSREAERVYARISLALRHDIAEKIPLMLVGDDRDLPRNEQDGLALVRASNAPPRDHLFISVETFERNGSVVLAHELTHHFIFELLPRANREAPWLEEGLPDHYSGSWERDQAVTIREAVARNRLPAIQDLTAADRQWGHALLDFIASEYGARGIRQYLSALAETPTARLDAIRRAFDIAPSDLTTAFHTYVRAHFADR